MGKQDHAFPIKGRVGKLTFYKTPLGHMVREARGVSADKLLNDPKFEITRQNMAEFGRAGKASKLIRDTLRPVIGPIKDGRMIYRLSSVLMQAVKLDAINDPGLRNLVDGDLQILNGFEFNAGSFLASSLIAPFGSATDRVTGKISVDIASFIPKQMVVAPKGATHFQINLAGADLDFPALTGIASYSDTGLLPVNDLATAAIHLEVMLPAASVNPLITLLGIEFYQVALNGKVQKMSNGTFNSLAIVAIDKL